MIAPMSITPEQYERFVKAAFIDAGVTQRQWAEQIKPAIDNDLYDNDGMPIVSYQSDRQYRTILAAIERIAANYSPSKGL